MPALRLPPTRRAALCLALVAAALAVVPHAQAGADAATLPTPTKATATATTGAVKVAWVAPANAHRWKVLAFADGRYLGQRTFAGTARQGRVEHIPPGTSVTTWVVAVGPNGEWGTWATSPAVRLPRDRSCPAMAGTCVHVNARATTGPATGVGLGLLHGVTADTDPARIAALMPRHWRISALDAEAFRLAEASGASTTALLSDPWHQASGRADGLVASPWADDFAYYRWWVAAVAAWHVEMGLVPDRWEVQNEPSVAAYDPAYPPTKALLVEQHAVAAEAIRSVIPGAEVVGPAVSPFLFGHGIEDIEAFTTAAAARAFGLGALTWHENTGSCAVCDGGPASVRQHIDDARAALRAAGLGDLPIDITEYAAPFEQLQPGAIVGYLSALADGRVRYGGTACWERPSASGAIESSCSAAPGTLDGLLLPDGTTPTDAWWTYAAYAQLASSGARLATTTVDDPATSVVASSTGAVVRALVGRHTGCTAADGPCPGGTSPGVPEDITVRMTFPSAGQWDVVVSRIASSSGASGPAVVLTSTTVSARTAVLTVGTFTVADGEVLQVSATRR
jgi:hypothetical protein